jgi:hypothetical protein
MHLVWKSSLRKCIPDVTSVHARELASSHSGLNDRVLGFDIKHKPMIKTSNDSNQCLVGTCFGG